MGVVLNVLIHKSGVGSSDIIDAIISVGYRIKSHSATLFRILATKTLKEYLLKGYAINQRFEQVEKFAIETQHQVTETKVKLDFL